MDSDFEEFLIEEPVKAELLIAAPAEALFNAWVDPAVFQQWWGPHGFETLWCEVDLRLEGELRYCMAEGGGEGSWGKFIFKEIDRPHRLAFLDCFTDKAGFAVVPAFYGLPPSFPVYAAVVVTIAEQPHGCLVTIEHHLDPGLNMRAALAQGWQEMLEKMQAMFE